VFDVRSVIGTLKIFHPPCDGGFAMMSLKMSGARTLTGIGAVIVAALGVMSLVSTGCSYSAGGSGYSDDTFLYPSTAQVPKSVTLVDTRTGQTLWSYEIPVGRRLVVSFNRNVEPQNALTPDRMNWDELDSSTSSGSLENSMLVPDRNGRRLDVRVRLAPELPAGASAAPNPSK